MTRRLPLLFVEIAALVGLGAGIVGATVAHSHHETGATGILFTIHLPTNPQVLTVDTRTSRLFVAGENGRVMMLNADAGQLVRAVNGPARPNAAVVDEQADRVFIAGGDGISVLDASTGRLLRRIGAANAVALAVDRPLGRVFVANYQAGSVSVLGENNGRFLQSIQVGAFPSDLAVDRRTNRLFVTHDNADTVLDARTGALIRTIVTGQYAGAAAVDERTNRAFLTHFGKSGRPDDITMLDASTGRLLKVVRTGGGPGHMAVDARANRVFVAHLKGNRVSVLNARSGAVLRVIPVGGFPLGIAVDAALGRVCVSSHDSDRVSVLDAGSGRVVQTVVVGRNPADIVVDARTHHVFVADTGGRSVSVFSATPVTSDSTRSTTRAPADALHAITDGLRPHVLSQRVAPALSSLLDSLRDLSRLTQHVARNRCQNPVCQESALRQDITVDDELEG